MFDREHVFLPLGLYKGLQRKNGENGGHCAIRLR